MTSASPVLGMKPWATTPGFLYICWGEPDSTSCLWGTGHFFWLLTKVSPFPLLTPGSLHRSGVELASLQATKEFVSFELVSASWDVILLPFFAHLCSQGTTHSLQP